MCSFLLLQYIYLTMECTHFFLLFCCSLFNVLPPINHTINNRAIFNLFLLLFLLLWCCCCEYDAVLKCKKIGDIFLFYICIFISCWLGKLKCRVFDWTFRNLLLWKMLLLKMTMSDSTVNSHNWRLLQADKSSQRLTRHSTKLLRD